MATPEQYVLPEIEQPAPRPDLKLLPGGLALSETAEIVPVSYTTRDFYVDDYPPAAGVHAEDTEHYLYADGLELGLLQFLQVKDEGYIDGIDSDQYYPQWDEWADARRREQRAKEREDVQKALSNINWGAVAEVIREELGLKTVFPPEDSTVLN